MTIAFHPRPGAIFICDFSTGFRLPEMVKVRPVVIISPRRRTRQLVTVVPLSSTPPAQVQPWHHQLAPGTYPLARGPVWAKFDMVQTVALDRLDRVRIRDVDGRRAYVIPQANGAELAAIQAAVKAALGLP